MIKDDKPRKLKIDHILRLTDDTGMLHHANYGVPDLSMGYTTIDNARALIMAVKLFEQTHSKRVESLVYKYLSFLSGAQNQDGTFRESMGYNHEFLEEKVSEECFGRCLWALCATFSDHTIPHSLREAAGNLVDSALPNCMKQTSSRAIAYVILGLSYLDQEKTNGYISKLAALLVDHYVHYKNDNWHWFEERLTGCNAALPWALLTAFRITKESRYLKTGLESLHFLEGKTFTGNCFKPIPAKGLSFMDSETAEYDEQALEASEATSAYIEAFLVTKKPAYISKAKICFSWYLGRNSIKHSLLDYETGGCHDGIKSGRLHPNQGAESIVSFWLAYLEIKKYLKPLAESRD